MEMTTERWGATSAYLQEVFGRTDDDPQVRTLMSRAIAAGIPDIAVSSDVGRLLHLLSLMACRESRSTGRILELGTLAGYSGIWLARGLPETGRLTTVEFKPAHAAFATAEFATAGVGGRVEVVTGAALDVLPGLAKKLGPASLDIAFVDAVKTEYPEYFRQIRPLIRPGGLFIADNALGSNEWWVTDAPGYADRDAVDRMNRQIAADTGFAAACVPIRQGVLVARKL